MVGVDDLFWFYQNADTAILLALTVGAYIVWKRDVQPRLQELEQTQERRAERWADQNLSDQERDILLDDAHERIDGVDQAVGRLRDRLRRLETCVAAETGFYRGGGSEPDFDFGGCDPDDAPSAQSSASVTNDIDVSGGERPDRRHGVDPRERDRDSGRQQDRTDDRPEAGNTTS